MIEPIANFFESGFGVLATAFEEIDDREIEVRNITILSMAFMKFFEASSAGLELTFVEEVSRLCYASSVRGAPKP